MARSRTDQRVDRSTASTTTPTSKAPLRLRVPASLAVALLGASATVAMSFGGCNENMPDPVDAGPVVTHLDGGADAKPDELDANDALADADIDADLDARIDESPDAPIDARVDAHVDAALPPPDAPHT